MERADSGERPWLIAVHGGAGYHSTNPTLEKSVKHALRSACNSTIQLLRREGRCSADAVQISVCALEDDEHLNAGYGSNLTIDGTVECDASIMDGVAHEFGSAGVIQGVRNPITLARAIMQNSAQPQPFGRVPPLILVGPGAHAFAASSGLQVVSPDALISENAHREWQKWRSRLESARTAESEAPNSQDPKALLAGATAPETECSFLEDTVGAVACDTNGGMAAGVSSGGLLLKYPGRIGEAAVFGAGVWAYSPPGVRTGVACSVSGTGEAIIRAAFARSLAEAFCAVSSEDVHDVLRSRLEAFCEENSACGEGEPSVGVLVVTKEPIENNANSDIDSDFDVDVNLPPASVKPAGSTRTTPPAPPQIYPSKPAERNEPQPEYENTRPERTRLRLWCAFTTQSMAIAYASSEYEKPRASIMRQRTHRDTDANRSVYIAALPLSK